MKTRKLLVVLLGIAIAAPALAQQRRVQNPETFFGFKMGTDGELARYPRVLEYLLQHAGRVVSKQQIVDAIAPWGEDLTLNAVEVYVSRLRLKLDGAGVSLRTIRGFGYLLEAQA